MYQTIQLSSCVSVQGEFVEALGDGRIAVRDGKTVYRGRPIQNRYAMPTPTPGPLDATMSAS